MDGHDDGRECGHGSNLSQCECDEMCKEQNCARSWCALSVGVLVSVLFVQCHASGEVRCGVVISVVIGIVPPTVGQQ